MYINRVTINGRLTEAPIYKIRKSGNFTEEYAILNCHTEKPIRVKEEHSKEDIYFQVIAFGKNASSIKNRVYQGTPLLFELEIRNVEASDGQRETVLQAVKIHFMERPPRRVDTSSRTESPNINPERLEDKTETEKEETKEKVEVNKEEAPVTEEK